MERGKGGGEWRDGLYGLGRGGRGREAAGFLADVGNGEKEREREIRIRIPPLRGARASGRSGDGGWRRGRGARSGARKAGKAGGVGGSAVAGLGSGGGRWKKGPTGGPHLSVTRREEGGSGPAQLRGGRARGRRTDWADSPRREKKGGKRKDKRKKDFPRDLILHFAYFNWLKLFPRF